MGANFTFQDEPSRRLRQFKYESQDDSCKENLESNREPPCNGPWLEEAEAEVEPIAQAYTARDQGTLVLISVEWQVGFKISTYLNHNELSPSMRL